MTGGGTNGRAFPAPGPVPPPQNGPMPDIPSLFELSLNPWELVVRGTLMYWFLFLLFRFVLRRDVIELDLSIEDAAKLIISAGLVYPGGNEPESPLVETPLLATAPRDSRLGTG